MPIVLKIARPMRFSSRDPVEGPLAYGPFTRCSVGCCCSVEFLTPDEAKGPGFTIIGIYSPSMPYDAGIETVRIWMPNFPFWRLTSGISIFPELSVTFTSPPNSFLRLRRERTRPLVTSFRRGGNHETHRFLRSRDELFDTLSGRAAECQPEHHQGLPRRVHSASPILPRCAGNRSGKAASRTDGCFARRSLPGLFGARKQVFTPHTQSTPCGLARLLPLSSGGRAGSYAAVSKNPRDPAAETCSANRQLPFQRRVGCDPGASRPANAKGAKRCSFVERPLRHGSARPGV